MGKEFSKKALAAMENTIYAYDKSIADLENGGVVGDVLRRFRYFGSFLCTLCAEHDWRGCSKCPITHRDLNGGAYPCLHGPLESSYHRMANAIRGHATSRQFLSDLKYRRKALLKQFSDNGWELK